MINNLNIYIGFGDSVLIPSLISTESWDTKLSFLLHFHLVNIDFALVNKINIHIPCEGDFQLHNTICLNI